MYPFFTFNADNAKYPVSLQFKPILGGVLPLKSTIFSILSSNFLSSHSYVNPLNHSSGTFLFFPISLALQKLLELGEALEIVVAAGKLLY